MFEDFAASTYSTSNLLAKEAEVVDYKAMTAPLVFSDGERCASSDQWITIDSDYKKYVNLT